MAGFLEAAERKGAGGVTMFDRYSDCAKRLVVDAQHAALGLRHNYIGTEHLLLAVVRDEHCPTRSILSDMGIDLSALEADVLARLDRGVDLVQGNVPFTERSKRVLEIAMDEANLREMEPIDAADILVALVREGDGVAGRTLRKSGITVQGIRAVRDGRVPPSPGEEAAQDAFDLRRYSGPMTRAARLVLLHAAELTTLANVANWEEGALWAALLAQPREAHTLAIETLTALNRAPEVLFADINGEFRAYEDCTPAAVAGRLRSEVRAPAGPSVPQILRASRATCERTGDVAVGTIHLLLGLLEFDQSREASPYGDLFWERGLTVDSLLSAASDARRTTSFLDLVAEDEFGLGNAPRGARPIPTEVFPEDRGERRAWVGARARRRFFEIDVPSGRQLNSPWVFGLVRTEARLTVSRTILAALALIYAIDFFRQDQPGRWWVVVAFVVGWNEYLKFSKLLGALTALVALVILGLIGAWPFAALTLTASLLSAFDARLALVWRRRSVGDPSYGIARFRQDRQSMQVSFLKRGNGVW